ncbi:MAG: hypothetical protein J5J06_17745 [Phycisphaerae bacterium]|nr:hypothetical protein [Phycisphaerae bacterium]
MSKELCTRHTGITALVLLFTALPAAAAEQPTPPRDRQVQQDALDGTRRPRRGLMRDRRAILDRDARREHRISPEQRDELRAFVREYFPMLHENLEGLRERNPQLYERRVERFAGPLLEIMETMKSDPELGAVLIEERRSEAQLRFLAAAYRRNKDDDRKPRMEERIRELTEKVVDLRQKRRELEIRRMETRLSELRTRQQENARMRDKIVEREVERYLTAPVPLERENTEDHDVPDRPR